MIQNTEPEAVFVTITNNYHAHVRAPILGFRPPDPFLTGTPLSNHRTCFWRLVHLVQEELSLHIWCAQGSLRVHRSNSTVFKNIFSRGEILFFASWRIECIDSAPGSGWERLWWRERAISRCDHCSKWQVLQSGGFKCYNPATL